MTIDINKIRPGDRVTLVPLEVISVGQGSNYVAVLVSSRRVWHFDADLIAAHHPAPREFQVGDRVTMSGQEGSVLCVDGPEAWVLWDPGYRSTMPVDVITLVEGGE